MTIRLETATAGLSLACALLAGLAFCAELDARREHRAAVVAQDGLHACTIGLQRADSKLEILNSWMAAATNRSVGGIGGGK